jgi:hypothetical protein
MTMPFLNSASRRGAIKLLGGGAVMAGLGQWSAPIAAASSSTYAISDSLIGIDVDSAMRTRVGMKGRWLTAFAPSEVLRLADDTVIDRFLLTGTNSKPLSRRS